MTNEVRSQVRLVRCPRCQQVLPEPPESIIYKCGGCDAVLHAKKRKNGKASNEPRVPETCPLKIEQVQDSKKNGISSLHQNDSSFSSANTFLGSQYEFGECSKEQCEQTEISDQHEGDLNANRTFSDEFSQLNKLKHHETARETQMKIEEDEYPLDRCIRKCECEENGACETESPEYTNSLTGSSPFTQHSHDEVNLDVVKNHSPSPESNRSDQNDFSGQSVEYIENAKSSEEISHELKKPSPVHTEVDQSTLIHQEQPCFDRISSVDTLENLPLDNRSQPTVTHRDLSKSPITRSYYAYDGSASSCDDLQSDDEFKDNSLLSRKTKAQYPAKNFSDMLPRRMHRTGEGRNKNQEKWLESRRRGGNRRQLEMENGNPSTYNWESSLHHHHHHHSSFYPPNHENLDKIELLRMVYDLENQLQKTHISNGKGNRRFPQQDADESHWRCPVIRCSQGTRFPNLPRIPFSGEPGHYRHQMDCHCLQCSPQVLHCSSQLPLGSICCNKSHFCNALHSSSSQSPQNHTSSEYSNGSHKTKSGDKKHKDHEMKRRYAKMRHVLPVAGGAPIVACHHCSKLLQLPKDFGVFKRRCYELKCNACKKVLHFEVQNRTHVVPNFVTNDHLSRNDSGYDTVDQPENLAPAPPPSEVSESSDVSKRNLSAAPQRCPHAESLSYSDDLGPSFFRSCSTEVESSSATPMEDRKMKSVMIESRGKPGNSHGKFEPSKWGKTSSEIVDEHPTSGSPLHRLMGYSTVSQVFK